MVGIAEVSTSFDRQYEYVDWQYNEDQGNKNVDVIMHHSDEPEKIKMNRLIPGFFIFNLHISLKSEPSSPRMTAKQLIGSFETTLDVYNQKMTIDAPYRPAPMQQIQEAVKFKTP